MVTPFPDIFVSNIADNFALQESHFLWLSTGDREAIKHGKAPYEQASERLGVSRSGWGWDARMADFDNSGALQIVQAVGFIKGKINRWPELQSLGTSNDSLISDPRLWPSFRPGDDVSGDNETVFFVEGPDHRYHNIAAEAGIASPMLGRGIALADVDGDGRLDFIIAGQWGESYLFKNESPAAGNFLALHLMAPVNGGPARSRNALVIRVLISTVVPQLAPQQPCTCPTGALYRHKLTAAAGIRETQHRSALRPGRHQDRCSSAS